MIDNGLRRIILRIYLSIRGAGLIILSLFIGSQDRPFDKSRIRRILIIRMDGLGDFIVTTPLLKILRKGFPSSSITLAAKKEISLLAANQPWIDDVIAHDGDLSFSAFLRLARKIRQGRFDLAIDCLKDYTLRTALLAYASRATYRLGFDISGRGTFFNLKARPGEYDRTMAEEMAGLASGLGIIAPDTKPELVVSLRDKAAADELMAEHMIARESFMIGVHPGGRYQSQRWPAVNFARLIDNLDKKFNVKIVLLGSRDEAGLLESVSGASSAKTYKFYPDSLNLLGAMIDKVQLFVGNNSGPLHMASALGKRTVSTMGPTDRRLWPPAGYGHIILRKDIGCSPCGLPVCKDHGCMNLITVDEVFSASALQIERIRKGDG